MERSRPLPYLMQTYAPPKITFVRGRGAYLFDRRGRRYLDFIAGLGVNLLGHCPPPVVRAIVRQSHQLIHSSNLYRIEQQVRLARLLCENSFADKAFFCNSGAEAVETIIKIARRHAYRAGEGRRRRIVCFEHSFHGRTYGALSATWRPSARRGFGPLLPGVVFAPFDDLSAAGSVIDDRTCLVLVEPVLGEGGVVPASRRFLVGLRRACDRHGALLAFDEVQCGLGRLGTPFAYQHFGVEPDLLALAKGLGGGLPIGAVLAREPAGSALEPGTHGSTFGGNPLSCSAALVVCRKVLLGNLAKKAAETGQFLTSQLQQRLLHLPVVREIRAIGLMVGIELTEKADPYVDACLKRGLLVGSAAETVLRLLPPLVVTRSQCRTAAEILEKVLAERARTR